ncbi:MAG: helix-turn-helix domain-containing protein [Armatimonadota bacterium]
MRLDADVLTLSEAAAYLRVHPRTLRMKASEGEVPGAKVGRVWRFHRQQLERWLMDGGARNTSDR